MPTYTTIQPYAVAGTDWFTTAVVNSVDTAPIDDSEHSYTVNGRGHSFNCVPSKTTNFKLFCLSNPELAPDEAEKIWEYYRDQFVRSKLKLQTMTGFRDKLCNFVTEKYENTIRDEFSGKTLASTRHESIDRLIRLSLWLELQYKIDTICDRLSENISVDDMRNRAECFLKTAVYNNYVSYFAKSERFPYDPEEYKDRKLFVKNVFEFTHRSSHIYICESEIGAVELKVDRKHSPFIVNFSKQINDGVTINVVNSEIKTNIDDSVPMLKVKNWFIE